MEDGRYVTLFLKSVRRSALTGAMAGSLLLAATASAFADTAKSQATGPGASSGDATLTKTTTSTTQGGNSSSTSTPTTYNQTGVANTSVKSAPKAQSQNIAYTDVQQHPYAMGGKNTNTANTSLTCTATNTTENSQTSTRMGDNGGSSGNNTHEPTAKCTHEYGSTRVYQSAKGFADAANVSVTNDYKSTAKTGNSSADAQVSPEGKAKISDSGAGATSATTSNTNGSSNGSGNGNGNGSDKAKSVASSKGPDDSSNGASSGDAKLTKETNSSTYGGHADAYSNPSATNYTTVGDTYVKSAPKAYSYNLAGVNITCYPTAIAGSNDSTLMTTLTGTPFNDTSFNTQTSTQSGSGSGNSGHNSLKPDAQSMQHTGSYRVKQSADANASCGTITIVNHLDSNATTGDSTAKADVSPTGEASIKNSGAAATSATTSKTYGEGYGGVGGGDPRVGGGTAIITSGGSTNIGTRRGELAAVKAAESSDDGTRIITSGGSTNITAPIAMVAGVTVPPVTPPGGVRAESVAGLAPTGRPGGFSAETEGQPAFTFLLGLILGGFGIVWIGGRRLFVRD